MYSFLNIDYAYCNFFSRHGFSVVLESVLELALLDQAGLELRDLPASASQVLGLKVCATTARLLIVILTLLLTSVSCVHSFV